MVAFSTVKVGDRLYQVSRQKMGNTTMSSDVVYDVVITEVHGSHVMARWNGNPPSRWSAQQVEKLRRSKPKEKPSIWDLARQAREARDRDGSGRQAGETP